MDIFHELKMKRIIEIYSWDTGKIVREIGKDIHFQIEYPMQMPGIKPINPKVVIGINSAISHKEKVAILFSQPCATSKAGVIWRGILIVSAEIGIRKDKESLMPVSILKPTQLQDKRLDKALKEFPGHSIYECVSRRELKIEKIIKAPKPSRR